MEQAGAASVVPTGKKYESRKRETNGKDVQAIRSFLESLSVYEADALRVSIAIADGKATAKHFIGRPSCAQPLSQQRKGQRAYDCGQCAGTSAEPCVSIIGACVRVLRQASVCYCKQVVAIHRRGCGGQRRRKVIVCRLENPSGQCKIRQGYGCIPFLFFPYFGLEHA